MTWGIKGTDTVAIVKSTQIGIDDYGNPRFSETKTSVSGCLVEYGVSEITQTLFRDSSRIHLVVHFPVGTVVDENTSFEYLNESYRLSEMPIIRSRMVGSPIPKKVIVGLERVNG